MHGPTKFLGTDGFVDAMASPASASARALNLTIYFTAVLPGSCSSNLAVPIVLSMICFVKRTGQETPGDAPATIRDIVLLQRRSI
jgi:hypothetical protein